MSNVYGSRDRSAVRPPQRQVPMARGGGDGGRGDGRMYTGRPRRRRRWVLILVLSLVALVVLALVAAGGAYSYVSSLDSRLRRVDVFSQMGGKRAPVGADGAINILLIGSDSRNPDNADNAQGHWRSDTLLLMHITRSKDKAYLISIPRDLYIPIAKSKDGKNGGVKAKVNAAYAWGGPALTTQTVEDFTGVHINHVVMMDFFGLIKVTDALGGVDMKIDQNFQSIHPPKRQFKAGMNHLDGAAALDYVRQRKQFPDGDFARIRHQQEFLKALLDKAVSSGTMSSPFKLYDFAEAMTAAMVVDKEFSLVDLGMDLRHLRGENLTFSFSPNKGSGWADGESVVVNDRDKALALYKAVAADDTAGIEANLPKRK